MSRNFWGKVLWGFIFFLLSFICLYFFTSVMWGYHDDSGLEWLPRVSNQQWFRLWLGVVRRPAIPRVKAEQDSSPAVLTRGQWVCVTKTIWSLTPTLFASVKAMTLAMIQATAIPITYKMAWSFDDSSKGDCSKSKSDNVNRSNEQQLEYGQ